MLGNNKLEKRHYIKLTFLLFILGFCDLQEGVKDRCATITPRDSGGRLFKGESAVLRVFFVCKIRRYSARRTRRRDTDFTDLHGFIAQV